MKRSVGSWTIRSVKMLPASIFRQGGQQKQAKTLLASVFWRGREHLCGGILRVGGAEMFSATGGLGVVERISTIEGFSWSGGNVLGD